MDTAKPLLDIRNLTIRLPHGAERDAALRDVSFRLHANEVLCLVGESGSGKSLSVRAILQLLPPGLAVTQGGIHFDGADLLQAGAAQIQAVRGAQIGMVFQEPMTSLNPLMTVGDQVAELFIVHRRASSPKAVRAAVIALFAEVGLPTPEQLYGVYPHQLSGGQRQRVVIAMALALEPRVLLADEPTTALDVTTQAQVLSLIRRLQRKRGMGVVFITHDFGVVADIADRVVVLRQGEVVESGTVQQVLHQPRHPYTQELIAAVPRLDAGRRKDGLAQASVALSAQHLRKTYAGGGWLSRRASVTAVDDVSFQIRRGETLGIVGESGSGKSSLARLVACLTPADGGSLTVGGTRIDGLSQAKLRPLRKTIQVVFQDPYGSLNPRRTIQDTLARGPLAHGQTHQAALRKAAAVLDAVGLGQSALQRYPHEFSGGQRQRIAIARALILEPQVLIADEPVSALDVSIQKQILALLEDIQQRLNLAMLFITHDLRVASSICDTIAVMQRGRIIESGNAADIFRRPAHPYTQQLIAAIPGIQAEQLALAA